MAGINLSQSGGAPRSSRRSYFDKGFLLVAILFSLVLAAWGVVRWFAYSTEKQALAIQEEITAAKPRLEGDAVNRIAGVDARLKGISTDAQQFEMETRFALIERSTLPDVRLTEYTYDVDNGEITIGGIVSDYKIIAQQLTGYKDEAELAEMRVDALVGTDDGRISFTFKAETLSLDLDKN